MNPSAKIGNLLKQVINKQYFRMLSMINYKDFSPQVSRTGLLGHVKESDSFQTVVKQANLWLNSNPVKLVNIETVLLPNLLSKPTEVEPEKGASTVGQSHVLFQCVRVWYTEI